MQLVCEYSRAGGFTGEPANTCPRERGHGVPSGIGENNLRGTTKWKWTACKNPIVRTQHASRFGCTLVRGVGMERSESGMLLAFYIYTHINFLSNKLERFLKCGGQSGGPPMFATLLWSNKCTNFSMGQGKGKNSALQPHPQQCTSLANSTRHALLVSATFQFRSSVIALPQKAATGKTSLSTSSQNYKRTWQLGCFCCLPILLAKRISRTIIIKLRPRQSVKMSKFVEDRKRWCLSKMLSMRYQSKIKRFTNNTPHPKSHKLGNKEGTRKRRHTTAKTVLSTHKFS